MYTVSQKRYHRRILTDSKILSLAHFLENLRFTTLWNFNDRKLQLAVSWGGELLLKHDLSRDLTHGNQQLLCQKHIADTKIIRRPTCIIPCMLKHNQMFTLKILMIYSDRLPGLETDESRSRLVLWTSVLTYTMPELSSYGDKIRREAMQCGNCRDWGFDPLNVFNPLTGLICLSRGQIITPFPRSLSVLCRYTVFFTRKSQHHLLTVLANRTYT